MTGTSRKPVDAPEVDAVVVGYGPVGATLANLLGIAGVPTLVLERDPDIYGLPRAVHFDDEVMRVFQTIGLAEEIAPHLHVSPGMRFVDPQGRLILDWSRPMGVGPQGWHPSYRFHQPDLERTLRSGVARHPTTAVRSRCDVFGLDQDADGVEVRYEDLSSGKLHRLRARYVVGCDGARSVVRRFIGSCLEDLGFHERWLVTDLLLKRPMPHLGDHSVQHCDPARPSTYVRGTGNRRRWEIALLPDEGSGSMTTPERVWPLLAQWITPADAELERAAVYTFHSALAEKWRAGRLFIAGDSAHQTPPFLGQGMCAGIRDAANLAWKLTMVLRGDALDDLLDTYGSERSTHTREYIELAVRLGGLINTKAMEAAVPAAALTGEAPARMHSIKPKLGPGLSATDADLAGQVAPQPRLSDGARLDDRVGYRFAALARPAFAASLPGPLLDRMKRSDIALVPDDSPELQDWLEAAGIEAALVRPDRYVLGTARDRAELERLLASVPMREKTPSFAMAG